jgi:hypothetical protein
MTAYLLLLLSTALVNNVVLVKFLGLCPFMGVSRSIDSALGMGLATTFVITLACAATWILEHCLLIAFRSWLSADSHLYPGHRCHRAVCRDGGQEVGAGACIRLSASICR